MQVLKIQERTKNRVDILLDNDFSFVLYKGEVRLYKITEGKELSEASFREIMENVLPKRAKLRAMNLLKVRPYTVKGLTDKLSEGGYPDSVIKNAIDYVSSYHYLDDYQYALDYINTFKDRKSRQRMIQDLIQKGVSKNDIENALNEEWDDEAENLEEEQIRKFLIKKKYDAEAFSYEDKMKLLSALVRKGYGVEVCKKVMKETSYTY